MTTTIIGSNNSMSFLRQHALFDPEQQTSNITIIGAGSTGSFIALTLAKLGFNHIDVFDNDVVDNHNLPNQFYRVQDIGKPKVIALQQIIEHFTGITINANNSFVENVNTTLEVMPNMIVVLALDKLETRKMLVEQLKGWPIKIVDPRMGGEGWQVHVVDFSNTDEYDRYYQTLLGTPKHLPCGAQSIIYTILNVSSEVARIIKNIDTNQQTPKVVKREMNKYLFLAN